MKTMPFRRSPRRSRSGFTLIEILVVVAIVMLASLIALPTIYNSVNGRQVTDAARIFTGSLVGIRDAASRYNSPRGIRLLPDPVLTIPAPGLPGAGSLQLCYNRMIPISRRVTTPRGWSIGPQLQPGLFQTGFPPRYAFPDMANVAASTYLFPNSPLPPSVLMVEESPYRGGYITPTVLPNSPTNWYWSVRVGDKIKIGGTGRAYTIVGPCVVNPWTSVVANQGNPELFVNVGPPGDNAAAPANLLRAGRHAAPRLHQCGDAQPRNSSSWSTAKTTMETDMLMTGSTGSAITPPSIPISTNPWSGRSRRGTALAANVLRDDLSILTPGQSPSVEWVTTKFQQGTHDVPYIIQRRARPHCGVKGGHAAGRHGDRRHDVEQHAGAVPDPG